MRIIAIDGPAGAGKSTISRQLAKRLDMDYLDTGAMYRAVTAEAMHRGVDLHDVEAIAAISHAVDISVGERGVHVDGRDVSEIIRTPEVTVNVAPVASNSAVRADLRDRQRAWAEAHDGGVIEGRDIASVVFPEATLKIYLTATPLERAKRRAAQYGGNIEEIAAALAERDHKDMSRTEGKLQPVEGGHDVATDGQTIDEIVDRIIGLLEQAESPASTLHDGEKGP